MNPNLDPDDGKAPSLEQMLAAFDPKKHGGEAMADCAVGREAFGSTDNADGVRKGLLAQSLRR